MEATAGLLAEREHHRDRLAFGGARARGEPRSVRARIAEARGVRRGIDRARQLGVHQQRQPEPGDHRHRIAQIALADVRELVHPRWHEEALEAAHAGRRERS